MLCANSVADKQKIPATQLRMTGKFLFVPFRAIALYGLVGAFWLFATPPRYPNYQSMLQSSLFDHPFRKRIVVGIDNQLQNFIRV
jgi:hypothetical protein